MLKNGKSMMKQKKTVFWEKMQLPRSALAPTTVKLVITNITTI